MTDYDMFMQAGSAGNWDGFAASNRSGSGGNCSSIRATTPSGANRQWTKYWQTSPLKVPVMLVHSLWDQEDIYGRYSRL